MFKLINIKYKAKRIQEIAKDDKVIGHIYGINLSQLDYDDENSLNEYIIKIKEIINKKYHYIYIEETLPINIKRFIADSLSINLPDSRDIKVHNIPYIIDGLKLKLKRDVTKEEILIISNDKDEVLWIIDSISSEFNFISVLGLNDIDGEDVYEKILDDKGISIYFPKDNSLSLKRYGFIINTLDEPSLKLKEIKNNTIIIDFSYRRPFVGINKYIIEDIFIDIGDLGLNENPWIGKEINSDLYTCLNDKNYKRFCRIYKNNDLLTIEDFTNQGFRIKGGY